MRLFRPLACAERNLVNRLFLCDVPRSAAALFVQVVLVVCTAVIGPRIGAAPAQFFHVSVDQGLSQSTVQAIMQDHVGFLWFGTEEGLNRYDGYGFVVFKHDAADPHSLPDNVVSALFEDKQRRMWVGTEHGLCLFDWRTATFTSVTAVRDRVAAITETSDGTVWVAAVGGGLYLLRANATAFASYVPVPNDATSIASFQVAALLQDHRQQLWVGTRNAGVDRFEPAGNFGRFIHYRHIAGDPSSLSHDEVWGLAEDREGQLWVATYGGGLNVLDPTNGGFRHYRHLENDPNSLPTDLITAVFTDRAGTVWAGTDGAGLLRYDRATDRFVAFAARPGDPQAQSNNVVRTLFQDRQDHIWVGTFLGGASQLKPSYDAFLYYTHDDADPASLSDPAVGCFTEGDDGIIWLGTESGWLNRFDRTTQRFAHFRYPAPAGATAAVLSLHHDRKGRLWVGSYRGGLARFDPATSNFTVYRNDPRNPKTIGNDEVWSIAEDADGALWLATNAGVDRFDPERGEVTEHLQTPTAGGFSFTGARALRFDGAGNLWIGNFGGLTMRPAHGGTFVHYQHRDGDPNSLGNDAVVALHLDRQGRLWAGTLGGGMSLLDAATGTFTTYSSFPSNVVNAIEEDPQGRLWISTNHGLSRFTPSTGTIESFDLSNGLQSLQFHLGAGLSTRSGRILFGSMEGFYELDPKAITPSSYTPRIVLTAARIFNVPSKSPTTLPALEQLTLKPNDKVVSVEFVALDYTFPRRNQYAYQLAGLSDRWIQLGDKHDLTFTNLAPATYTLSIRASNNDGEWRAGAITSVQLQVLPPYWATWWFRSGAALGFVGLLLVLHRLRVRRLTGQLAERQKAEAALRESEERFARAFHVSPVPMCIVRLRDRAFVDMNNAFLDLVGYPRSELIGQAIDEMPLLTESDRQRAVMAMGDNQGIPEMDFQVRMKSGAIRTVLASVAITQLAGEACALGVGTDITEREQAEKARRDSEERYRRFFNDDLAGAFICRADGTLLACNPAFARMFGFDRPADAIGSDLFALFNEPGARESLPVRLSRERRLQDIEQEMRRRDGRAIHVLANIIGAFDANNVLVGINGYAIDTTDRKKLEAQLLHSQKMEAVGQLAGGVAHDFNNLLTGIIGYTDLLLMDGRLDEETCASLQEIRGAGSRAAALTRQLLAFSRRQLLQPRIIDLNALITDVENMLRRLIGEDIVLEINLASDLGRIKADRSQIEQVVMNLAVNARDAMPQGGRMTIATTNVMLDEKHAASQVGVTPGDYVRLTVSDTGCGMDPEVQARIFEPFFTTKAVGKGTGLGLSTVYGIVKQSNGHITLASERGLGSVFTIYLPRAAAAGPADEPHPRSRALTRGSETILLVEDNEVVRKATSHILRQNGYYVIEASEPAEALDVFDRALRPVQLLLTDVVMPGMNGRELADRLTARAPSLRVVFMSGYTDDAISRHGGLSADFAFIEKPFAPDTLIAKIQDALRVAAAAG
jgi:PAS domain S-box-containing protein